MQLTNYAFLYERPNPYVGVNYGGQTMQADDKHTAGLHSKSDS
jgi:hypothetical protein